MMSFDSLGSRVRDDVAEPTAWVLREKLGIDPHVVALAALVIAGGIAAATGVRSLELYGSGVIGPWLSVGLAIEFLGWAGIVAGEGKSRGNAVDQSRTRGRGWTTQVGFDAALLPLEVACVAAFFMRGMPHGWIGLTMLTVAGILASVGHVLAACERRDPPTPWTMPVEAATGA